MSKITPHFGGVARGRAPNFAVLPLYGLNLERILPTVKRACATLTSVTEGLDKVVSSGFVTVWFLAWCGLTKIWCYDPPFGLADLPAGESVSGGKDGRVCHHSNLGGSQASKNRWQDSSHQRQRFIHPRASQRQSDGLRSAADSDGWGSVSGSGSISSDATGSPAGLQCQTVTLAGSRTSISTDWPSGRVTVKNWPAIRWRFIVKNWEKVCRG